MRKKIECFHDDSAERINVWPKILFLVLTWSSFPSVAVIKPTVVFNTFGPQGDATMHVTNVAGNGGDGVVNIVHGTGSGFAFRAKKIGGPPKKRRTKVFEKSLFQLLSNKDKRT